MSRATTIRTLAVSAAVAATVALNAAPAAACSPKPDPDFDPFAEADIAITGQVTKVRPRPGEDGLQASMAYEATIRVSRVYKGKTGPALRVRSTTQPGLCGFGKLRVGQRLGLLLHGKRSPFSISSFDGISKSELEESTGGRSHRPGRR